MFLQPFKFKVPILGYKFNPFIYLHFFKFQKGALSHLINFTLYRLYCIQNNISIYIKFKDKFTLQQRKLFDLLNLNQILLKSKTRQFKLIKLTSLVEWVLVY